MTQIQMTTDDTLEDLITKTEALLLDQHQTLSTTWLINHFHITLQQAQLLLQKCIQNYKLNGEDEVSEMDTIYIITGRKQRAEQEVHVVRLVRGSCLEEMRKEMDMIVSEHIYALQVRNKIDTNAKNLSIDACYQIMVEALSTLHQKQIMEMQPVAMNEPKQKTVEKPREKAEDVRMESSTLPAFTTKPKPASKPKSSFFGAASTNSNTNDSSTTTNTTNDSSVSASRKPETTSKSNSITNSFSKTNSISNSFNVDVVEMEDDEDVPATSSIDQSIESSQEKVVADKKPKKRASAASRKQKEKKPEKQSTKKNQKQKDSDGGIEIEDSDEEEAIFDEYVEPYNEADEIQEFEMYPEGLGAFFEPAKGGASPERVPTRKVEKTYLNEDGYMVTEMVEEELIEEKPAADEADVMEDSEKKVSASKPTKKSPPPPAADENRKRKRATPVVENKENETSKNSAAIKDTEKELADAKGKKGASAKSKAKDTKNNASILSFFGKK
jgi:hypothetical protein